MDRRIVHCSKDLEKKGRHVFRMSKRIRIIATRAAFTAVFTPVFVSVVSTARRPFSRSETAMIDRLFDPHFMWLSWIGVGIAIGAAAHARARRAEEQHRGRLGGPSLFYLRWEIRALRLAIKRPWLRWLSADLDKDLADLNAVLVEAHGMPALPCVDFRDAAGIDRTDEYLRRVLPHLTPRHIEQARDAAKTYTKQIASARAGRPRSGRKVPETT